MTVWLDFIVEAWFICDLLVSFNTAFVDAASGSLVRDFTEIRVQFLKTWFLCDVLSAIPIHFIELFDAKAADFDLLKALRILKIFRLFKLLKFDVFHELVASGSISPSMLRLSKIVLAFFYLLHLVACCYYTVAEQTCVLEQSDELQDADSGAANTVDSMIAANMQQFCPEPWRLFDPDDRSGRSSWMDRYLVSIYWAILSMLGENARPVTNVQYILGIIFLLVGIGAFSTILGSLNIMLTSMDAMNNAKYDQVITF